MEQKKWFYLIIGIGLLFVVSLSGGIGKAIGTKEATKLYKNEVGKLKKEESTTFNEGNVQRFLASFYTFKRQGDNYDAYKGLLTSDMQQNQLNQIEEIKKGTNPQLFGNSLFRKSDNFIRQIDDQHVEVISFVEYGIDLLNAEEQVVTKEINSHVVVKLRYIKEKGSDTFLIDTFEPLTYMEVE